MIYGLYNKNTGEVRYVGRTGRNLRDRLHNHRYNAKTERCNSPKGKWIRKVDPKNIEILKLENPSKNEKEKELWWMEYLEYLGCNLLNVADYETGSEAGKTHIGKLPKECVEKMGEVSDVKLAEKYKVDVKTIKARREQREIEAYSKRYDLPDKCIEHLGKKSDVELARIYGVSREVIRRRRKEEKIQPYQPERYTKKEKVAEIKWFIECGDMSYREIGNKYNVSKSCIGEIARETNHKQVDKKKPQWVN
jgi:Mor family transcriptional regulator